MKAPMVWLVAGGSFLALSGLLAGVMAALRSSSRDLVDLEDGRHVYLKRTLVAESAYVVDDMPAFRAEVIKNRVAAGQAFACMWLFSTAVHLVESYIGNIPWLNTVSSALSFMCLGVLLFYAFRPIATARLSRCVERHEY